MVASAQPAPLSPRLVALAQFPLASWGDVGPPPALSARGRFLVPELEDLETLAALRSLLVLAHRRGIVERTWLRDAPRILERADLRSTPAAEDLARAFRYAQRAGSARAQLATLSSATSRRLLPFVTWRSPLAGFAGSACAAHLVLEGHSAESGDPLIAELGPPLGYDCGCYFAAVNLAKARRLGLTATSLRASDLRALAPAGWEGAPPAIDPRDEGPALAALARAQELLAAVGVTWPQGQAVGVGWASARG